VYVIFDLMKAVSIVACGCIDERVQSKVQILCQSGVETPYKVVAVEWYNGAHGYVEDNCPRLAICFDNGRCQLMRTELDDGM